MLVVKEILCPVKLFTSYIATLKNQSQWTRGLRCGSPASACWDCVFESRREQGCLCVVNVVFCQVEVSATGWSFIQRSPTECGVCLSVIVKPRQWGGRGLLGTVAPRVKIATFRTLVIRSLFLRTTMGHVLWHLFSCRRLYEVSVQVEQEACLLSLHVDYHKKLLFPK
jgi:hypothetical protein